MRKDCRVTKDLTVTEEGLLVVRPGVTVTFDAAVVLGVNGTLIAEVEKGSLNGGKKKVRVVEMGK